MSRLKKLLLDRYAEHDPSGVYIINFLKNNPLLHGQLTDVELDRTSLIYSFGKALECMEANRGLVMHLYTLLDGDPDLVPRVLAKHNFSVVHVIPTAGYTIPHDLLYPDVLKSNIQGTMIPWCAAYSLHLQNLCEELSCKS